MSIQNYLNQIKSAVFGKDVRQSIHDAIKQCYDDASIDHDNANMEVKLARGSHDTLNERFTSVEENIKNNSEQLDKIDIEKAKEIDLLTLSNRVDELVINSGEGTEKDAEIVDGRTGGNGKTYDSLGKAIREQYKDVNSKVTNLQNGLEVNILKIDKEIETHYGLTFTKLENGTISINGISTENIYYDFGYVDLTKYDNETNLTLSGSLSNVKIFGYFRIERSSSSSLGSVASENGTPKVFKKSLSSEPNNAKYLTCSLYIANGTTLNNLIVKPMVNVGGNALNFISSNLTQPIKEYVDNKFNIANSIYAMNEYIESLVWTEDKCLNIKGQQIDYEGCSSIAEYLPISELMLKSTIINLYDRVSWTLVGLCFYDRTKAFVGYYSPSSEGEFNVKISDIISQFKDAYYIRINKLKDSKVKFIKTNEETNKSFEEKSYKFNMIENAIFIGDSVTEGFVVDGETYKVETKYSYPTQLKKIIPQWNITVKAKSGASAVSWRNMFYSSIDFSKYDLIVVELGYNGSDFGYFNMEDINTPGRNTYEYKKLIADIRSQNANAEIILVLSSKYTNSGDKWDWKPILELVASESNCKIINLRDKTYLDLNLDKYHGVHDGVMDYVHFNRIGYNAKAFVVSRLLLDVLS